MDNARLTLPGKTTGHRVLAAIAVFAAFYVLLVLVSHVANSAIATGSSHVTVELPTGAVGGAKP